ncbi:MAG: ABC transporter permease [Chloroflexi bacterium]|nr:ABC transporter permease [Chloroflexota bacterium]
MSRPDKEFERKLSGVYKSGYSIVVGKAFAAGVRSVFQAIVVLILALIMGVDLHLTIWSVPAVLVVIILAGMCFSALSILLASLLKTRERVMGIWQAVTMPLFFASSAVYPISIMPDWLKVIALINPLSYIVDALRSMLVEGQFATLPRDLGATLLATVVITALASWSFQRIVS